MWEIIVWTIITIVVVVVIGGLILLYKITKWIEEADAVEERF